MRGHKATLGAKWFLFPLICLALAHSVPAADRTAWTLEKRGVVGRLDTPFTVVAYYVPRNPKRILVLAHGYPWPDGTVSDEALAEYARGDVERWTMFAEANGVIVLAPAFGGRNFLRYGQMSGRLIRPDEFVDLLVDGPAGRLVPRFTGKFSLHGHSAGGQFAARYLVMHPERIDQVILSAPSTYPMPNSRIAWPYGMAAPTDRGEETKSFVPDPTGWLRTAMQTPVTVLVGARDLEKRPPAPGQEGSTRIERAEAWVRAMQKVASSNGRATSIHLVIAQGLDHDEAAMALPAQRILVARWAPE